MAYRRRQVGMRRSSSIKEEILEGEGQCCSSSLAAQAIRACGAHGHGSTKVFDAYDDALGRNNDKGFWGVLARKAKSILDEDAPNTNTNTTNSSFHNPTIRKGLDKITSSLNHIGDTFDKALEEGRTKLENETRKLQNRRKGTAFDQPPPHPLQTQTNHDTQLKASRDVAMATAAKAKLLLRELKTVKADLAFAKLRCSQLEEENKVLREGREKSGNAADDDLIRLQLETLLAEKARLAHENSMFSRENRFLREIVEYHQLTMQDVVYVDEGSEEVTEVYPYNMLTVSPPSPKSPRSVHEISASSSPTPTKEIFPVPMSPHEMQVASISPATEEVKAKSISVVKEDTPANTSPREDTK